LVSSVKEEQREAAVCLAFHQKAADELGGDRLGGASLKGWGESWECLGGYGSGYGDGTEVVVVDLKKPSVK